MENTLDKSSKEEIIKAFGGCTNCYGKGYHTQRETAGTSRSVVELDPYLPCDKCDRGKQFKEAMVYKYHATLAGVRILIKNLPHYYHTTKGEVCISKELIEGALKDAT